MTLATRCPSCGTVFRVGQDQLLASEGWVRCGRCNGVFNATEVLFDIETGEPVLLAPGTDAGAGPESEADRGQPAPLQAPQAAATSTNPSAPAWAAAHSEPQFDAAPPRRSAFTDEPLLRAPSRADDDRNDEDIDEPIVISDHIAAPRDDSAPHATTGAATGAEPDPRPDLAMPDDLAEAGAKPAPGLPAAASGLGAAASAPALPSFLQAADRAALWRRPAVRTALGAGVLLLAGGVGLQMALLWRDNLGAHVPAATPVLQALCQLAGCSVQPLRRIEQLSVDSSGLNRLEGSSLYRLQMVLHNRGGTAVMMPALDLTLTDKQGQLVARRVLAAAELGLPQPALQAGQEVPIKVLVSTGERQVDGYTLELFYP